VVLAMALEHEQSFGSTHWVWKRVKMRRPPEAKVTAARRATYWHGRRPLPMRSPVTLTIKLRGGPECWVEVHARGGIGRYPGVTAIYDVLRDITNSS
jgi:hypothetical protein